MRKLAQDINEKMQYIHEKFGNKIELIGHGIGAHACGQAARIFKKNTGNDIHKIIGNRRKSMKAVDGIDLSISFILLLL